MIKQLFAALSAAAVLALCAPAPACAQPADAAGIVGKMQLELFHI